MFIWLYAAHRKWYDGLIINALFLILASLVLSLFFYNTCHETSRASVRGHSQMNITNMQSCRGVKKFECINTLPTVWGRYQNIFIIGFSLIMQFIQSYEDCLSGLSVTTYNNLLWKTFEIRIRTQRGDPCYFKELSQQRFSAATVSKVMHVPNNKVCFPRQILEKIGGDDVQSIVLRKPSIFRDCANSLSILCNHTEWSCCMGDVKLRLTILLTQFMRVFWTVTSAYI